MASEERLRELEEKYEGYTVYDNSGSKIGKVDDLFVDEQDHEEYIGVKMGLLGSKSTLIPTEIVRVNEQDRSIEVSESKDHVKDAPSFSDDEDIDAAYEERIRRHFGLETSQSSSDRGSYGAGGAAAGYGASDRDEQTHDSGTSDEDPASVGGGHMPAGYDAADRGPESSGVDTHDEADEGDRESSTATGSHEQASSSGTDAEYGERSGSGTADTGYGSSEGSSGPESHEDESRDAGNARETGTGERYEDTGTSSTSGASGSTSSSTSKPTTSRQTEETETFQEGGRTKIRRRIIREEVVDADDQDA